MHLKEWTTVHSSILAEAFQEMRSFLTEGKRQALCENLRKYFNLNINKLILPQSNKYYYLHFDKSLFDELCRFIRDEAPEFNYKSKLTLSEFEHNAIKMGLETIIVLILHCKESIPNFMTSLKLNLAVELSKDYDLATEEFIKWYEDLFVNLEERLKETLWIIK